MTLCMRHGALVALAVGFLLPVAGPRASAQDQPPSSSGSNPGQPPPPPVGPTADSYVVSLSTGELINTASDQDAGNASSAHPPVALAEYADGSRMAEQAREFGRQFFYGVSAASVYTSEYAGLGTSSQVATTISPYLALMLPTRTGSLVLQYDAVINPHDTSVLGSGAQAYQAFSVTARGALTRRWSWTLAGSGGYGSEATRLQGPLTFLVVQNIPILDASSTVLLPATNVLFFANTGRLVFQKNERNFFGFTVTHLYTGTEGVANDPSASGPHSNALGARMDYEHMLSTRLTLRSYADEETVLSGLPCSTYGGGIGLSARLRRAVRLDVEGGPQFTTSGCGGQTGANFSAVLAGQIGPKDRVYASASRVFTAAYQTSATWQDTAAAGFSKSMGRTTLNTDAGFVRETLVGAVAYHGYFVAPRLHVKIVHSLGLTAGYRAFRVTGAGLPSGVLNNAAVSLDWYPAGVRLK